MFRNHQRSVYLEKKNNKFNIQACEKLLWTWKRVVGGAWWWAGPSEVHHQGAVKTLDVVYDVTLGVIFIVK